MIPVSWTVNDDEGSPEDFQRGEPWGPTAVENHKRRARELNRETVGRVGAMLAVENRRSMDHRYDETELEDLYEFTSYKGNIDPVAVLKAIQCYEYQSCEHPEWETSEAHEFCQALRSAAIDKLPGYSEAQWEVTE